MKIVTLYRYQRSDGGISISPVAPESIVDYTTKLRLIADEGKILSKDDLVTYVIDTDTELGWEEIDDTNKE